MPPYACLWKERYLVGDLGQSLSCGRSGRSFPLTFPARARGAFELARGGPTRCAAHPRAASLKSSQPKSVSAYDIMGMSGVGIVRAARFGSRGAERRDPTDVGRSDDCAGWPGFFRGYGACADRDRRGAAARWQGARRAAPPTRVDGTVKARNKARNNPAHRPWQVTPRSGGHHPQARDGSLSELGRQSRRSASTWPRSRPVRRGRPRSARGRIRSRTPSVDIAPHLAFAGHTPCAAGPHPLRLAGHFRVSAPLAVC